MALANAVKGGLRPSQSITWKRADGSAEDLTGATITGQIRDTSTRETRTVTGVLLVLDGAAGVFVWDYSAADVAEAGQFDVQFTAAFAASPSPARTVKALWTVEEAI